MKLLGAILALHLGVIAALSGAALAPAESKSHWSFIAPACPAIPSVKNTRWVRNEIDYFVLARLEREQVRPSPEADRATLIRRLSFDLRGLPPSPDEVRAFVQDTGPQAYETLVDRLLASPHFGEQWARHWLDLAHYADSDGYEKDSIRPYAYLYRDWVIRALNRDLPFDRFTLEQLAGDLVDGPRDEQKIATGFQRQTLTNTEGGVDKEEFRCKAVVDRVNTLGAVWLGLTVGCAECHSHKYDPISQREFYQLYAFFNQASETELPAPQPREVARFHEEKAAWDITQRQWQETLTNRLAGDFSAQQTKWEQSFQPLPPRWTVLQPKSVSAENGAKLTAQADGVVLAEGDSNETERYVIETEPMPGPISGVRLEALRDFAGKKGPGRGKSGNFVLTEFSLEIVLTNSPAQRVALTNASADFAQEKFSAAATLDGDGKTGWGIKPQTEQNHVVTFQTCQDLEVPAGGRLRFVLEQSHGDEETLGRFRLAATGSARPLPALLLPDAMADTLNLPPSQRTDEQRSALARYYREEADPEVLTMKGKLAEHARREPRFPETKAAIVGEEAKPRVTHIHVRGDFLRQSDAVQPATLEVLHPFKPRNGKADRLDLAHWLMEPANPLTGRVTVNRYWRYLFGRGLTTTADDFGARGEKPSHPELLDWLATQFPRLGWSQKAMIRLMANSATYRQSSQPRADLAGRDPNNILLARQSRFRLEAENVRDVYLAASGLLDRTIGGPSVRPPLPADIAAIGYANSVKWKQSDGSDRYRRGLYVFFQRTVPYPMLMTFDAPDSNVTCTRRERSNTPLQALTLLNDPVFFECAQTLGRQWAAEPAGNPRARIRRGFEACLNRPPTRQEENRLQEFWNTQYHLAESNRERAAELAGVATEGTRDIVATATAVALARILMNLDEFMTRE